MDESESDKARNSTLTQISFQALSSVLMLRRHAYKPEMALSRPSIGPGKFGFSNIPKVRSCLMISRFRFHQNSQSHCD